MEFRQLGKSGLKVPVLCFGTATFGGTTDFFKAWGETDVAEATRLIDICMEAGVNFFDTADVYSEGHSEEILGAAIKHLPREKVLLSTKATFAFGEGPNNAGSSRVHLTRQINGSLKRLKTDYIDVYHMHGFDALTPMEETLNTLDTFVRDGKVRYIAASNFSGWHLQKSLDISERYGWARYVAHQVYYSLIGRMGAAAAGIFRGLGGNDLEPARLGSPDRQNSARPADTEGKPLTSRRRGWSGGDRRLFV
jgi:aryl-alcohol dehydrogenase-like predicted oxidoreductase